MDSDIILNGRQKQVRWALFANDTLAKWDFSLTPGLRYDHTSTTGGFLSPSLGLTYALFEKTTIRTYVARGFNTPGLGLTFDNHYGNSSLKPEKVWSYSLGGETAVFKYFWLKTTGFLHEISDTIAQSNTTGEYVNQGKQRRLGVEVELRTLPVWNTSLIAGYTYIDSRDRETGLRITGIPTYTYDLGIDYNDNEAWRGALRGHYIWWNAATIENVTGMYKAMIWDLNLARKVTERGSAVVEVFFTAHNIFNGAQYATGFYPNPKRWFEGGLRCKF
jgi:vitamin B12 transporter